MAFGKEASKQGQAYTQQSASRYSQMLNETQAPAAAQRNQVGDYYSSIIKGGPEAQRVAAPQVSYLKRQMAAAQGQIRDNLPRGGAQQRARMSLAAAQPGQVGKIFSDNIASALERLNQLAQFNTQAAMSAAGGVSQAGQGLSNLGAQQNASETGVLGSVLGPIGFALAQQMMGPKQAGSSGPVFQPGAAPGGTAPIIGPYGPKFNPIIPEPAYDPLVGRSV